LAFETLAFETDFRPEKGLTMPMTTPDRYCSTGMIGMELFELMQKTLNIRIKHESLNRPKSFNEYAEPTFG
jgi:hypothetical protein